MTEGSCWAWHKVGGDKKKRKQRQNFQPFAAEKKRDDAPSLWARWCEEAGEEGGDEAARPQTSAERSVKYLLFARLIRFVSGTESSADGWDTQS